MDTAYGNVGYVKNYESHIAADTDWTGEGQRLGAQPLGEFFARTPRVAVAFSGGCDSAYLLTAARAAGCEIKAYLVKTAFQPAFEQADAHAVIDRLGVDLETIEIDVFDDGEGKRELCSNPADRCYLCKRMIFSTIAEHARKDGFDVLVDGTNASDDPARRPGFRALAEVGVVSPLRRAGMTKADVRAASGELEREMGLPAGCLMSAKPSFPCLAVYVPEGEAITPESLAAAAASRGIDY